MDKLEKTDAEWLAQLGELAFQVTRKGGGSHADSPSLLARAREVLQPVREEALLLLALLLAAAAVAHTASGLSGLAQSDAWMWMAMLLLQALPYAAAVLCAGLAAWPERVVPLLERPRAKAAAQALAATATHTAPTLTASAPHSGQQTSGSG